MLSWKEREALYEIHEFTKKGHEVWGIYATGAEISKILKAKNEMNGYVEGLGGDKNYACWAVEVVA